MRKRYCWGIVTIAVLILIWGNSMLPGSISGTISSEASQGILSVIYKLIPNLSAKLRILVNMPCLVFVSISLYVLIA